MGMEKRGQRKTRERGVNGEWRGQQKRHFQAQTVIFYLPARHKLRSVMQSAGHHSRTDVISLSEIVLVLSVIICPGFDKA
ncbi:hypothetical protein V6N13_064740 [Hibiscus sabdariffa]